MIHLSASKLLAILLLAFVAALAFGGSVRTRGTSGTIASYSDSTSYSTWTSTFYSTLQPTTFTRFSTATLTTDHLSQTVLEGPYVQINGSWAVNIEGRVNFELEIKNLIDLDIESGIIRFDVSGRVHRDDIDLGFGPIQHGETLSVRRFIGIPTINVGAKVTPTSVSVTLAQKTGILTIPVEIITRTQTMVETYRRTVTDAYTVGSESSTVNTEIIWASVLIAVVIGTGIVYVRFKARPRLIRTSAEQTETSKMQHDRSRVNRGGSYLVEDDIDTAYKIFKDSIISGMIGLCVTRVIPARIKERYGLQETPVVWLTDESTQEYPTVKNLQELSITVSDHVEKTEKAIVLVDGVEYLVSRFGFASVYQFLQTKRSQMERTNNILIIAVFKEALEQKEVRLLEREFQLLTPS